MPVIRSLPQSRLRALLIVGLIVGLLAGLLPQSVLAQNANPTPTSVSFPGSYAPQISGAEWEPADPTVQAADDDGDGVWTLSASLPGGSYEFKAAINGTWDENYGQNGEAGGDNLTVDVPDAGGLVTFSYNRANNQVAAEIAPLPSEVGDDLPPAVGDGFIGIAGLLHQSRSDAYRTPFGALPFDTDVTLRFRTFTDDAEGVDLLLSDIVSGTTKTLPLRRVASDTVAPPWGYDYWEVTLNSGSLEGIHGYTFQISDGDAVLYYAGESRRDGGSGRAFTVQPTSDLGWDIYTYDPDFVTPDWAKNAAIYQIFPDRFRNGNPANDPTANDPSADDWFYENERDDPCNRQPYPWPDAAGYDDLPAWAQQQDELIALYTFLGQLRGQQSYLPTGEWETLITDDAGLYLFGRKDASGGALIAINRSPISQTVSLELAGYLPRSAALIDAATGQTATVSLREVVQPLDFRIWQTEAGIDLTAPDAPVIESVEEGDGVVSLTIAIPPLTSRVVVRRSLVDGGFLPVGVIEASDRGKTVTFVDEGLANGQPVYYRAAAFNDVGLRSERSASVQAVPHTTISGARLVPPLLTPTTIEQVISTTNPAGPVQAVVTVPGVTDGEGAGEGILARAGFTPAHFDGPANAVEIRWVEAEYAGDDGAGDLYAAAVLPDAVGDYLYGFIFSTTGGRDWVYADTTGMSIGAGEGVPWAAPGKLRVVPSDDTEAPKSP